VVALTLLILRSSPAWVHYEGIGVGKGQRW